jgi:hypothetical protein
MTKAKRKIEELRDSLQLAIDHVDIPVLVTGSKVLKMKLQNGIHDYLVPDPMLVAMKAATNWYYIVSGGKKMFPVCEPPVAQKKTRSSR